MKRKALYLIVACLTLIFGLTFAAKWGTSEPAHHTFRLVSEDGVGGPGLGTSGRGIGCLMKTWEGSDGVKVYEDRVVYASGEEAHQDFEEELKGAEKIIERRGGALTSVDDDSVVAAFISPESKERVFRVIRLNNTEIYHAGSESLEYALAFK